MSSDRHYRDLAPGQRQLVDLMRQIGFGRIENLLVQRGQPVFEPGPRVFREIKLEREAHDAIPAARADYLLKVQVRMLLCRLEALGNGRIESIVVAHGLPLRMTFETTPGSSCPAPTPVPKSKGRQSFRRSKSLTG